MIEIKVYLFVTNNSEAKQSEYNTCFVMQMNFKRLLVE